ncbi:MAG: tRNA (adenosine(37)-N6)-dimethylallyltransferase MiaA [Actinomycetota bacterium]|nr:tRNA (adenosine(37)-N6)-dimethylallyltransferase MiaA [Actinomycetota bacterium]MEC9316804.1 tRNA (adenosine(37)-N6)-dimethylallyltransferase MiaA [Actinomycetota bacterium]MEE3186745.1 tRNA (adenosine(37)-N6)-dimethylallyltransferase MiaA [Actinomycetota bacterium]
MCERPVVLLGPTASGKSACALEIARRVERVELLSADSMQVYRQMNIGTAKPSAQEQSEVRHHLIDLVEPDQPFSLVDYQTAYDAALLEIQERDAIPLLVGGTGLYLRAVIDRLTPPPRFNDIAAELEKNGDTESLHRRLRELDPTGAARMEATNRRRIIRALEVTLGTGKPFSSFGPGLDNYPEVPYRIIGIDISRQHLDQRISERYAQQMEAGFLEEVQALSEGDLSHTAAQALGYKELLCHVRGEISLDEALEVAVRRTKRFARRQQRWFRRDPRVEWVEHGEISTLINEISSQ